MLLIMGQIVEILPKWILPSPNRVETVPNAGLIAFISDVFWDELGRVIPWKLSERRPDLQIDFCG